MAAGSKTSRTRSTSRPAAWQALEDHYQKMRDLHLRDLFADDPTRGERMAAEAAGVYLEKSRQSRDARAAR
jgi:glucose-6-phosphate isomerase